MGLLFLEHDRQGESQRIVLSEENIFFVDGVEEAYLRVDIELYSSQADASAK
jgi:hypothetical protein